MKFSTSIFAATTLLFSAILSPYVASAVGSEYTCDADTGECTSKNSSETLQLYSMDHDLFNIIQRFQLGSGKKFGRILDAGTGPQSFRWISTLILQGKVGGFAELEASEYTAITAKKDILKGVVKEALKLKIFRDGKVMIGDWATGDKSYKTDDTVTSEEKLLEGEMFDSILADYLVGSVDGFAPYYQDLMYSRLVQHLKPGGRMFVTALEPIPDSDEGDADVMCRVRKVRDACILLSGDRPYREFPMSWTERHLELAGLKILHKEKVPLFYDHETINRQINAARLTLNEFPSEELKKEMEKILDDLEAESKEKTDAAEDKTLELGFHYVIIAELPETE